MPKGENTSSRALGRSFRVALCVAAGLLIGLQVHSQGVDDAEILRFGMDVEPIHGMDPHLSTAWASMQIYEHIYNGLVTLDSEGNVVPDLALSWDVSDDGLTYTFAIREGVRFHNGRELIADDVKYSFDRLLNPDTGAPLRTYLAMTEQVEVLGRNAVSFRLRERFAGFLNVLATVRPSSIIPREVVEAHGDLRLHPVGTGPFRFVSYEPGVKLTLEKNDDYFETGAPLLDGIVFEFIPDETTRVAALRTGRIDFAELKNPLNVQLVRREPGLVVRSNPGMWLSILRLNTRIDELANPDVRLAMSCAIDRMEIIQTVLEGEADLSAHIPPGELLWAVDDPLELPCYVPDLDRARQMMVDAGFADGFSLTAHGSPQYAADLPALTVVQQQLARIGITVLIQQMEFGTLLQHQRHADFEMQIGFSTLRPDPDAYLYTLFHASSEGNYVGIDDSRLDALLELGRATLDVEERRDVYALVQERLAELSPMIHLFALRNFVVHQDTLEGYEPLSTGYHINLRYAWLR